ncbi:hypothetical protein PRVXH_000287 [Proteinivorax hydrogeniformans]|uniref:Bacterial repeat domain-containing protein n=1 Tax=Proteinivorax hydrogeniformans TaxID=1826727 RepID=A0AAU8HUC6_9FIRM
MKMGESKKDKNKAAPISEEHKEDKNNQSRYQFINIAALILVISAFLIISYYSSTHRINAQVSPEGSATITGTGRYKVGEGITIKAEPNEGYAFVKWTAEDKEQRVPRTRVFNLTVEDSQTYVAHFEKATYTYFVQKAPGSQERIKCFHGEEVILKPEQKEGYIFEKWTKSYWEDDNEFKEKEIFDETLKFIAKDYTNMNIRAHFINEELEKYFSKAQKAIDEQNWLKAAKYVEKAPNLAEHEVEPKLYELSSIITPELIDIIKQAIKEENWAKARQYLDAGMKMPTAFHHKQPFSISHLDALKKALKNDKVITKAQVKQGIEKAEHLRPAQAHQDILQKDPNQLYKWFKNLTLWSNKVEAIPTTIFKEEETDKEYINHYYVFEEQAIKKIDSALKQYHQEPTTVSIQAEELTLDEDTSAYVMNYVPNMFMGATILINDPKLIDIQVEDEFVIIDVELKEDISNNIRAGKYQIKYKIYRSEDGEFRVKEYSSSL